VVVLDFWATWCGPCRGQYPLYQQVKQRFAKHDDVVFLGINTDDDHSLVKPFLEEVKWSKDVYFEDGLQTLLKVSSIPATIVINKEGQIVSRMNGYLPDRFVDMLSERIYDALGVKPAPQSSASLTK
jgi:thiol-disulfide isomerase/thioredoxin